MYINKNPFRKDPRYRLELTFRTVKPQTKAFLDFGCGWGELIYALSTKIRGRVYGLEIDKQKVKSIKRSWPKLKVFSELKGGRLPLADNSTNVVSLLDVLEHVPDEKVVLDEIHRVLESNGLLLLSVPNKGLTEVFDPGNIKFRFPSLHRFLYTNVFRQTGYAQKYQEGELIGDITKRKHNWHRHYSLRDLENLLEKKFIIKKVYYFGLFFPLLSMLEQALVWKTGKGSSFIRKLILSDARFSYGKFSFSIFINATKI